MERTTPQSIAHVCHLSSAHPALDGRIFYKQCRSLVQAGYRVTLIAPHERDQVIEGVHIRALKRSKGRFGRLVITVGRLLHEAIRVDADIYQFHDPELLPVGLMLRMLGKKVIYDVHEDYPKVAFNRSYIPVAFSRPLAAFIAWFEETLAPFLSGVALANPHVAERLRGCRTVFLRNYPLLSEFFESAEASDAASPTPLSSRPPHIVYVGALAVSRGVLDMVNAMEFVPESCGAELILVGKFESAETEAKARALPGWRKVRYLGWKDHHSAMKLLKNCRIGLTVLHPTSHYEVCLPTKLLEYMAAGIPVISTNLRLSANIIDTHKSGLVLEDFSAKNIGAAIQWLLENPEEAVRMGHNGRQATLAHYSWESEFKNLLSLLRSLLAGPAVKT